MCNISKQRRQYVMDIITLQKEEEAGTFNASLIKAFMGEFYRLKNPQVKSI